MELKKYKLGDIAKIEISGVDKKSVDGETPVRLCNFVDVYRNWAITQKLSENFMIASAKETEIAKCSIHKGKVAITKDSETRDDIGIPAYIADDFDNVLLGYHCALITPNDDVLDGKYLNAFMHTRYIQKYFENNASGSGQRYTLSNETIFQIPILLPSLEVQKAIGNLLSNIDRKIELNRQINDNLEQQAQALFKAWFVDFEPFRDGEFVNSVLGSTPKELPITYIENIPHNIESGKRPKGGATLIGVPSIGAENIKGLGYYDYSKTKYIPEEYAQTIKKGKINGYELLIYKDGGKPGYFIPNFTIFGEGFPFNEMYINEHVFLLDLMDCGYNVFAYFYMQTPYIMNQLNSIGGKAAIPGINTKDVECLPIYSNESPYVKKFGEIVLPFIKTILSNSLENAKQAKVRDTLLPKLMSGELKINEIETEK